MAFSTPWTPIANTNISTTFGQRKRLRGKDGEAEYRNEDMVNRGISNQGKADAASFWRDKSVLLTGATGLVGGWLTKRLIKHGANSVCLIRDWVPQSEFVRTG